MQGYEVFVCKKLFPAAKCLELTSNAGISSVYICVWCVEPCFVPPSLFSWFCQRILEAGGCAAAVTAEQLTDIQQLLWED